MAVRVADASGAPVPAPWSPIGGDADGPASRSDSTVVADDEPGDGPFPATLTALRWASTDVVVVLSCDLARSEPRRDRSRGRPAGTAPPRTWSRPSRWSTVTTSGPTSRGGGPRSTPLDAARRAGAGSLRRACADLPLELVTDARRGRCGGRRRAWRSARRRVASRTMDIPEIEVAELAARQGDGVALIDVRSPREFADARVPGAQPHPARRGGRAHRRGAHRRHRLRDLRARGRAAPRRSSTTDRRASTP